MSTSSDQDRKFACSQCLKTFLSYVYLEFHNKDHKSEDDLSFSKSGKCFTWHKSTDPGEEHHPL